MRILFWLAGCRFLAVFSPVEGVSELCGFFLVKALIKFMKAPSLWPKHLPKLLPPNTITGIRISTYGFWGDMNIQTVPEEQWIVWSDGMGIERDFHLGLGEKGKEIVQQ